MRKRVFSLTFCILFLIATISSRIGYIALSGAYMAGKSYNSYSLNIDNLDYQLYYRNGEKLTNNVEQYIAIIKPNEKCVGELYKHFSYNEINLITEELSKGYPIRYNLNNNIKTKYIQVFKTYYSDYQCTQLINKSSSGLLSYLNEPLTNRKISFSVDAKGRLLSGDNGTISSSKASNSISLTIDKDLQNLVDFACDKTENVCCIVMDVKTAEILACVNKPNDSYINKCFTNYPVGSVFKLVISACAIENDIDLSYNCTSKITVGDTVFSCMNNRCHGYQNLKEALANSCNCYFVNLALKLGADSIIKTAKALGFEKDIELYKSWIIKSSQLPSKDVLSSKGQLALLGFGQGQLLSTPLQICSTLCTIGNNGYISTPNLIKTTNVKEYAISSKTANKLVKYMRYVVENGTGKYAEDTKHKVAGKTATAQTGRYENNTEILNTWFAGIYPYDKPKYAIVVMKENGTSGSEDCCPIFRTIVENINKL